MSLVVRWERAALNDLKRLPRQPRERVLSAVLRFAETRQGNVQNLRGRPGEYRLRVGGRRVLFRWDKGDGYDCRSARAAASECLQAVSAARRALACPLPRCRARGESPL
jgi:mRNA-degrading endonuclease RelE of RelBE toxin-antitoxin system